MENLHLKNLKNIDQIDFYIENTIKKTNEHYDIIKKLYAKTYDFLLRELNNINIINPTIKTLRETLIDEIKESKDFLFTPADLNDLKELINNFKTVKDKDITIDTILDIENSQFKYKIINDDDPNQIWYEITPLTYRIYNSRNMSINNYYLDITIENNKVIAININE